MLKLFIEYSKVRIVSMSSLFGIYLITFFYLTAPSYGQEVKDVVQNDKVMMVAKDIEVPFQLSLFPFVQLFNKETSVNGLSLGIAGENSGMNGLSLMVYGYSVEHLSGVQISGINCVADMGSGLQIGVINLSSKYRGLQVGLFNFFARDVKGVQIGFVNLNYSGSELFGLQVGAYNSVSTMHGIQIGFTNHFDTLDGAVIGIINTKGENNNLLPFVYWSF